MVYSIHDNNYAISNQVENPLGVGKSLFQEDQIELKKKKNERKYSK